MVFVDRMFQIAQSGGTEARFDALQPWWDAIVAFAVDIGVLVALTSVTSDLFQGFKYTAL